ncbi:MAG: hypothetical protein H7Z40_20710 [Phycisphaerae bacterium]|nr:hypothetical protein [Gemmatimonadaceae bacterium]
MNISLVAMMAGLFVVPGILLSFSHRLRRRPNRLQSAFWGAIVAHIVAIIAATVASMISPEQWTAGDTWRGVFGFWMMLVAPLLGAAIGYFKGSNSHAR